MGKCDAHTFEYMQVWVCDLYMPFHVLLPVYVCVRVIQQHLAYAFIHLHLWGIWSMTAEHRQGGESAESHCLLTLKERKTIPPCVGEPTAFTGSHRFNSTCFVFGEHVGWQIMWKAVTKWFWKMAPGRFQLVDFKLSFLLGALQAVCA